MWGMGDATLPKSPTDGIELLVYVISVLCCLSLIFYCVSSDFSNLSDMTGEYIVLSVVLNYSRL